MADAGGTIQYLKWRKDVADHDYAAASSYLSIRFGEDRAKEVSEKLRKLPVIHVAPTTSCGLPSAPRCRCRIRAC